MSDLEYPFEELPILTALDGDEQQVVALCDGYADITWDAHGFTVDALWIEHPYQQDSLVPVYPEHPLWGILHPTFLSKFTGSIEDRINNARDERRQEHAYSFGAPASLRR